MILYGFWIPITASICFSPKNLNSNVQGLARVEDVKNLDIYYKKSTVYKKRAFSLTLRINQRGFPFLCGHLSVANY